MKDRFQRITRDRPATGSLDELMTAAFCVLLMAYMEGYRNLQSCAHVVDRLQSAAHGQTVCWNVL